MGRISDEDIERVRDAVDIVEIIGGNIPLKRTGRSFGGLCPFHQEKTPSLKVFPESQLFKCFGCGKSGTVFTFLMDYQKMEFHEAVRELADRAGISIAREDPRERKKIDYLYSALEIAAEVYHHNLVNPQTTEAENALQYLLSERRGLTEETIKKFKLGFAPETWDFILSALSRRFQLDTLETAGLINKSDRTERYYDYFRNRIMIPVYNARGKIIAFGGRTLDPKFKENGVPKFINSRESPIFQKGRHLYLLNLAARQNYERNPILVIEGYFDAIFLHQQGFTNSVASIGTSLTLEQTLLLKKYTDKVCLCFDPDEAGARAAINASETLLQSNLRFDVVTLPEGKDPDEFVMQNGREAFQQRIEQAKPLFEFSLETLMSGRELIHTADKIEFLKQIAPMLNTVKDPIASAVYCSRLASILGLHYEAVTTAINKELLQNGITVTSLSTEETEYQIASYLMHKPGLRAVFGHQLLKTNFKNPEIKLLFLYCTSEHVREQKRKNPAFSDADYPLFQKIYVEDLPKDILLFAEQMNITADEHRIRALVSRLLRSPAPKINANTLITRLTEETFAEKIEDDYNNKNPDGIKKTINEYLG